MFLLTDFVSPLSDAPGNLLGVHPSQLALTCLPTGDSPEYQCPILTPNKDDQQMHKTYEITNRKTFKLTDYSIYFNILPFPVIASDGMDLRFLKRGPLRFLEILVTDHRLRAWRSLYLEHLQKAKTIVIDDGSDVSADRKKRKTNDSVQGSIQGSIESTGDDQYSWPEPSADNNVDIDFMMTNKVSILLFIVIIRHFFPSFFLCFFLFILRVFLPQIYMKCHKEELSASVMRDIRDTLGLPLHLADKYVNIESVFRLPYRNQPVDRDDLADDKMYGPRLVYRHCLLYL